jgi:hypothetical protein
VLALQVEGAWREAAGIPLRNHLLVSGCAAPMMVSQRRGLMVTTTFWDRDRYLRGNLFYDLARAAMNRLAFLVGAVCFVDRCGASLPHHWTGAR